MVESPDWTAERHSASERLFRPFFGITDRGLVCGASSILVRMAKGPGTGSRLSLETDCRTPACHVVHRVRSIRGRERCHPSCRSRFERLAARGEGAGEFSLGIRPAAIAGWCKCHRLRLAEYVLDRGFSPEALVVELGFAPVSFGLGKYSEDQPRVPAGNGIESGRWDFDTSAPRQTSLPVVVAEGDTRDEDDKEYETRRLTGETTRIEDLEHGRGPFRELPPGIGRGLRGQAHTAGLAQSQIEINSGT